MKLLFDENLPEVLVVTLRAEFPDSAHVARSGWRVAVIARFGIVPRRAASYW